MDLTPFLSSLEGTTLDQVLLSIAISGKVAIAMKGRFLLRSVCESFQDRTRIGCAVGVGLFLIGGSGRDGQKLGSLGGIR